MSLCMLYLAANVDYNIVAIDIEGFWALSMQNEPNVRKAISTNTAIAAQYSIHFIYLVITKRFIRSASLETHIKATISSDIRIIDVFILFYRHISFNFGFQFQ